MKNDELNNILPEPEQDDINHNMKDNRQARLRMASCWKKKKMGNIEYMEYNGYIRFLLTKDTPEIQEFLRGNRMGIPYKCDDPVFASTGEKNKEED